MKRLSNIEIVRPEEAVPFDPAEFAFTLLTCAEMALQTGLFNRPTQYGFTIMGEDGNTERTRFSDIFENRFWFAALHRYRKDGPKYSSFIWRYCALSHLVESGALDDYICEGNLNDAAVHLAASFPLTKKGRFLKRPFLAALARHAKAQ